MFFGMPARIVNSQGKPIQGTLGFVGALLKIIRMVEPTHIICIFDGEHENMRLTIDAEYKNNRIDYSTVPDEDNPFSQLRDIYKALDHLKIRRIETDDCEADDLIASYALSYCENAEVIISSFDSDFFQLINGRVSVLRYRGEKTLLCSTEYVTDRFGILPEQYAAFKALVGDPSDNIKGVPGIGIKKASSLLRTFETLDNIIENVNDIVKSSARQAIVENIETIRRNYKIIKLDKTCNIQLRKENLKIPEINTRASDILKEIGIK